MRTRPRAIPLAMRTMRKLIHESPLLSYFGMGLRLSALRAAGTPLKVCEGKWYQFVLGSVKQLSVGWIKLKSDQSALPLLTTTLGAVNLASFLLCHLSVNLYSETKHTCTQHWRGDEWYQTLLLQISDTHCLQTSLLIFKSFANHRRKELFVSTANEPLVGTLMTIGNIT